MATEKNEKNENTFYCETCDFRCSYNSDYNRHVMTAKHKMATNGNKWQHSTSYVCECGKAYMHRGSLYKHQKKCDKIAENEENEENHRYPSTSIDSTERVNRVFPISQTFTTEPDDTDMADAIQEMVNAKVEEQLAKMGDPNITKFLEAQAVRDAARDAARDEAAAEQTRLLVEAISLNGPQCITNNNTTNNNQFNLNVFLNEDCKDAFTLKEVMDSIECTVTDLDRMDHDGYVATITRKILESIQDMAITERPIHCTDARRNTVCVKDDTGWEKNDKAMKMLANSVFLVGRKLGRMVDDWRVVYPDHFRGTVSRREQYHRLVTDIMRVNDLDVEARITSKVCKGIVLDRKAVMER